MKRKNQSFPGLAVAGLCFSLLLFTVGVFALNPIILGVAIFAVWASSKSVLRWVKSS